MEEQTAEGEIASMTAVDQMYSTDHVFSLLNDFGDSVTDSMPTKMHLRSSHPKASTHVRCVVVLRSSLLLPSIMTRSLIPSRRL
jgi:hypothetical protein